MLDAAVVAVPALAGEGAGVADGVTEGDGVAAGEGHSGGAEGGSGGGDEGGGAVAAEEAEASVVISGAEVDGEREEEEDDDEEEYFDAIDVAAGGEEEDEEGGTYAGLSALEAEESSKQLDAFAGVRLRARRAIEESKARRIQRFWRARWALSMGVGEGAADEAVGMYRERLDRYASTKAMQRAGMSVHASGLSRPAGLHCCPALGHQPLTTAQSSPPSLPQVPLLRGRVGSRPRGQCSLDPQGQLCKIPRLRVRHCGPDARPPRCCACKPATGGGGRGWYRQGGRC